MTYENIFNSDYSSLYKKNENTVRETFMMTELG